MGDVDPKTAVALLLYEGGVTARSDAVNKQRALISACAESENYEIVGEFGHECAAGGDCPTGSGFAAMLNRIEAHGVETIIVATASSFSHDATTRAVGYAKLREYGIDIVVADASDFLRDAEAAKAVARVIAIAGEFEKAVKKAQLRAIGERARIKAGPQHRKRYSELHPEVVMIVKRMHLVAKKRGERLSLRKISAKLAEAGHLKDGKPFHPDVINRMIRGPNPGRSK